MRPTYWSCFNAFLLGVNITGLIHAISADRVGLALFLVFCTIMVAIGFITSFHTAPAAGEHDKQPSHRSPSYRLPK